MKITAILILSFFLACCQQSKIKIQSNPNTVSAIENAASYQKIKELIIAKRIQLSRNYFTSNTSVKDSIIQEAQNFWVKSIATDLYSKWQNTPWDFNGTTSEPQQGSIACGYFVTALLQDMDLKINRVKLSTCAASQMMKSLAPQQKITNLSSLNYPDFAKSFEKKGKAVYIIGLDYHIGFIVNDGIETWFIHCYYVGRKGVIKEPIINSASLMSSKTKWVISLTDDKDFLQRWLKE